MEYKTQDDYEQRWREQDRARVFEAMALRLPYDTLEKVAIWAEMLIDARDRFAKQEDK